MSRLPRPHIPIAVRVKVAERQLKETHPETFGYAFAGRKTAGNRLQFLLSVLFPTGHCELHHRPALLNRVRKKNGDYDPPANDPDHLVYLAEDVHDIETRVRGQHGQHSDLGLARKMKRVAKNRDPRRRKAKIARPKNFRWPSRPFANKKQPPVLGRRPS